MIVHALRFGNVDLDGLTFVEWMSTQDAGTMDFGVYLDSLRPPEADDDEKARVYEAWEAGTRRDRDESDRDGDDDPHPHLRWPPRKVDTNVWTPPGASGAR